MEISLKNKLNINPNFSITLLHWALSCAMYFNHPCLFVCLWVRLTTVPRMSSLLVVYICFAMFIICTFDAVQRRGCSGYFVTMSWCVYVCGCMGMGGCGCVCVWVCMCVGVYVCGCVCMWVCMCVGVYVCGCVCVWVCMCVTGCVC